MLQGFFNLFHVFSRSIGAAFLTKIPFEVRSPSNLSMTMHDTSDPERRQLSLFHNIFSGVLETSAP